MMIISEPLSVAGLAVAALAGMGILVFLLAGRRGDTTVRSLFGELVAAAGIMGYGLAHGLSWSGALQLVFLLVALFGVILSTVAFLRRSRAAH
jgi:hypothetical protein